MEDLVYCRIDVLYPFYVEVNDNTTDKEMRWCQGLVLNLWEEKAKPTVRVEWDPMPDVEGYEESTVEEVVLLPTKWKKDVAYAWRMDVQADIEDYDDIDVGEDNQDELSEESDSLQESDDGSVSELESESKIDDDK